MNKSLVIIIVGVLCCLPVLATPSDNIYSFAPPTVTYDFGSKVDYSFKSPAPSIYGDAFNDYQKPMQESPQQKEPQLPPIVRFPGPKWTYWQEIEKFKTHLNSRTHNVASCALRDLSIEELIVIHDNLHNYGVTNLNNTYTVEDGRLYKKGGQQVAINKHTVTTKKPQTRRTTNRPFRFTWRRSSR